MIRWAINRDNVALAGSVIGLSSVAVGWLTLRPNRLATGTSLSLWTGLDWAGSAIILGLWLVCVALSLNLKGKRRATILGIAASLILVLGFLLTGLSAGRLLEGETSLARVSLGAGFWITVVGAYIVIFAARQKLNPWPVWRNLVSWSGLVIISILLFVGWLNDLSILREFMSREDRFLQEFWQHVFLFSIGVGIGTLIGVPLGVWATQSKRVEQPVFFFTNITQTIPSLALFGLLIAPLSALSFAFPTLRELGIRGVGTTPAIIALVIYSLLPIVRNTYVGLGQVDPAAIDAGLGMGMSRFQVFFRVRVPLAVRLIIEGVRTASVQAVGLATVAALIGAGGLGWFVFQGLGQQADDLILLGALPIIILALIVDAMMRILTRVITPRGLTVGHDDKA